MGQDLKIKLLSGGKSYSLILDSIHLYYGYVSLKAQAAPYRTCAFSM